jgi:hypothetical protein
MDREEDLYRLLGGVGALAFVLEGVVLPVSIAAHVLLFLVFRRFAPLRDSLLWFAAAGAASILTSTLLGITPVRLLLAPYPFEREAALTAAAAWLISAWFYWNIATAVFKKAGLASAALYTLGAGLFPMRIGFLLIAAAFLLLAYLFFKTGLEALQQKGGIRQPSHVTPGSSVGHQQK